MRTKILVTAAILVMTVLACRKQATDEEKIVEQSAIQSTFEGRIDLSNLPDYQQQQTPNYITKDNTAANSITNEGATLGRVLFYDKKLSVNNNISCGSCHKQEFAFGDGEVASIGVNGTTARHSMRLVNARFGDEPKFFWDERAETLEEQTTIPIQDHTEMGYSGLEGNEDIDDLITKLGEVDYYRELFTAAFGEESITEARIQNALAQFVRSVQSFDSKFDAGRASAPNDGAPFANYTQQENTGKQLFLAPPQFNQNGIRVAGGFGCQGCHRAPEFDIDPNSRNNGVIEDISGTGVDLDVERAPSLRDIVNPNGDLNGPLMHTGTFESIAEVLEHYNMISPAGNNNLDNRLRANTQMGQNLAMTDTERQAVEAFLKTLSGSDIYTNEMWSNPF